MKILSFLGYLIVGILAVLLGNLATFEVRDRFFKKED